MTKPNALGAFLRVRKRFWLLPMVITLLLYGLLLTFAKGSVLAPLVYALF